MRIHFTSIGVAVLGAALALSSCSRQALSARASSGAQAGAAVIEGPYFSDGNHIAEHIVSEIDGTRHTLDVAVYDITDRAIVSALIAARRRGVRVRIVTDAHQAEEPYSEDAWLRRHGVSLRLSAGYRGVNSYMHNKFAVFDGRICETGSFNWTTSANKFNYENAIFIHDPAVAARYEREFNRIWGQAQ